MAKAESQKQTKDLDAMTGPDEEEKEVTIDAKMIEKAFKKLREEQEKAYAAKREKERALAKVKVSKDDVKVLAANSGLKLDEAERVLKEVLDRGGSKNSQKKQSDGDLKACFLKYINEPPAPPVEG